MSNRKVFNLGDIVEMKKQHPCKKSNEFEITRMGADIKIKCLGCGAQIMMDRFEFQRKMKRVVKVAQPEEN